jgi:WD40-like Beta Propeller Repeat
LYRLGAAGFIKSSVVALKAVFSVDTNMSAHYALWIVLAVGATSVGPSACRRGQQNHQTNDVATPNYWDRPIGGIILSDKPWKRQSRLAMNGLVFGAAFSPGGRWLTLATERNGSNRIEFLDRITGSITRLLGPAPRESYKHTIEAITFSPDGRWLAFRAEDDLIAREIDMPG